MSLRERFAVQEGMGYEVPEVSDRLPYYLGSATLFGIIIQILSGIYLTQFYNSDPAGAHQSILYIIARAPLGDFIRSIHLWSANFILLTVSLHLLWVFWRGSYRKPREFTWWAGVLMLGMIFLLYFTGTVLPYDQEGYEAMAHYIAGARGAGIFGTVFTPEFTPSVEVLSRLYALHIGVLPLLLFSFLALHLYLIRFLDIHTHPGEATGRSTFLKHLRQMVAHGFLFLALAGLFSLMWPADLGYPGVEGAEVTKPPFFFLWIYALENWFGIPALVFGPPLVYLLFFLPPVLDRKESTLPRDRKGILFVGYGFILLLLALAIYAWLAPAQQHLM
ncbi:cytochrome b N-terminal domain-containing protein [Acidobacteria bacterium AH-259-L09]|nr:cytochrome b N-terminal domain-containing protein [Acidobacteria bacterium AH-259-L09]